MNKPFAILVASLMTLAFASPPLHPPTGLTAQSPNPSLLVVMTNAFQLLTARGTNFYTLPTIATNKNLWTYPMQISCVGISEPPGFQSVLIAPNWVLANWHTAANTWSSPTGLLIYGTNGQPYSIPYSGTNYQLGDMVLCQLVSNAPPACVPPWIFPCNYTNYFQGHTPIGMPCFWPHKNSSKIEYLVLSAFNMPLSEYLNTELCLPDATNRQGGTMGTSGDSGSPVFTSVGNELVLLYATTASYPSGCGVSDTLFIAFLTNTIPAEQLKILDLSNYRVY
jgi:hypothetical protein